MTALALALIKAGYKLPKPQSCLVCGTECPDASQPYCCSRCKFLYETLS